MKIGIVAKAHIQQFSGQLKQVLDLLKDRQCQPLVAQQVVDEFGLENIKGYPFKKLPELSDALIVFGGDGTLLSIARLIGENRCPILGVNLGSLGFLTEVTRDESLDSINELISGRYRINRRALLDVRLNRKGEEIASYRSLNEAVVNKGALARIITLETFCGEDLIANFTADGIIIATPTGSTGYSLSAGGPILVPTQELIVLTPICPHILTSRSLIVPAESEVRVKLKGGEDVMLTIDGQVGTKVLPGDEVICWTSDCFVELIESTSRNFFDVLRNKLKWAEN
jgi:NAD+ kinase